MRSKAKGVRNSDVYLQYRTQMGSGFPDNKAVLKQKGSEISDVLDYLY